MVGSNISDDAVARALDGAGFITRLIDNVLFWRGGGGVDEANVVAGDDEKADVAVEADEVDAGFTLADFVHEVFVVFADAEHHVILGDEGGDDALGGLLGEGSPFDVEAGVLENGRDEVSASDGVFAGLVSRAIEVPRSAEPTAHEVREGLFEKVAAFEEDGLLVLQGGCGSEFLA